MNFSHPVAAVAVCIGLVADVAAATGTTADIFIHGLDAWAGKKLVRRASISYLNARQSKCICHHKWKELFPVEALFRLVLSQLQTDKNSYSSNDRKHLLFEIELMW